MTPILVCGAIVERYVRMERRERLCQRRTESTSPFGESHLRAGGAFLPLRVARESRLKPHDFAVFGKGRRIKCVFVPYLAFPRAPRRLLETKLSLAAYRVHRSTGPCSGIQQSYRGSSFTQPPPKLCEPSRHDVAERLIGGSFPRGAPQPPPSEWLNSCGGSLPTWR